MFLDWSGMAASMLSTCFFIRLNRSAWLFGLIATLLNSLLYWQSGIYADTLLEGFYFLSTFYGWVLWNKPEQQIDEVKILSLRQLPLLVGVILLLFWLISWLLQHFTPTTVPHLDAITAALSIVAQWLMCHKIIATWALWFITDAIYAYLYYVKHLPFHMALMFIYIIMAVLGYWSWRKMHRLGCEAQR